MLTADGESLLTCAWTAAAALAVALPVQLWPDKLVGPLGLQLPAPDLGACHCHATDYG